MVLVSLPILTECATRGGGIGLGEVAKRYVKDNRRVQLGNKLGVSSLNEQSSGGGWRDGKTVVEMAEVAR